MKSTRHNLLRGMFVAAVMVVVSSARAQQVTGELGSPRATTTGGKQLPLPEPKFGGEINKLTFTMPEVAAEPKAERAPIVAPEPDPIDTAQR